MEASIDFDAPPALNMRQAYEAMIAFLGRYFQETTGDEITESFTTLLGELEFSDDGLTVDPGSWFDWVNAVNKVLSGSSTT